jgi:putative flippase GtrA
VIRLRDEHAAWVGVAFRYGVVGVIGTILHFALTVAQVEWLALDPVLASAIAFVVVLLVSYALNHTWTFAASVAPLAGLARYSAVTIVSFALNLTIMAVVTKVLHWDYRIGLVLIVLVIPAINFTLNARWTFRHDAQVAKKP